MGSPTLCFLIGLQGEIGMDEDRGKEKFGALRKIVEGLGYECVGVTLGNEEKRAILRVYIDSLGGILVKDCETVSRALNRFLDENEDYVRGQFYLEVSSPGIERPLFTLEDYRKFTGKKIRVRTRQEIGGQKRFTGILLGAEEDGTVLLRLETGRGADEDEAVRIPFETITKGNLVFEEQEKQDKRRSS
ncbi:MAG: ribosome maturation factor RimP [Synergistaceae bacterium]|nr:ribosome maturation factor RimP [Synergistaceae bacterium]